ncbi:MULTISPECIES: VCBS repeat-containing protein [Niastella]|uniref:VCBS repeat-containing protein n=1 Tax=Niastella soli TaxID=2821487 RepID=A0ABS3YVY3_9BACT|nr:VCBS repeat-containing protein [Niastella soli]MBO9202080.1 VCBS repeat-containing protein [Niastella soli]
MNSLRLLTVGTLLFCMAACRSKHSLFQKIGSSHSGITFNNRIIENDSINPLNVVNIYNGGGIGVGDFNNDGLQDLYFTGNMVPSKLYLNKGNFTFEDITAPAGVDGLGRWARGVAVVDINNDGLMDLYICNTIYKDSLRRRNILYVNQGTDKAGIPHFKDLAAAYGLDIHVQSTMAAFFDYDNDGDLDMYLTVNEASNGYNTSVFLERNKSNTGPNRGKLFRNDLDSITKQTVFHDVSEEAGVIEHGYGHGATVCDINNDGWKDIYVSDDFLSNNILYINNHNGTFSNKVKEYFKHTSFNTMGQDIVDINNDALPDVIELDMNPPDNYRKKIMTATTNYVTYQNFDNYGYQYQYVRNTLSLNRGPRLDDNDSLGAPAFSEIGFMSGISQTDWSWAPLATDFDNDSYRDIIITNGFRKDVSDHDFVSYRQYATNLTPKSELIKQIPEVKLNNFAFHNNGNLTFSDVTDNWGLKIPTFSNGAVYADLDNDGAMDMIINNINDEALLYRNTTRDKDTVTDNYLQISCKGGPKNINGLGAMITIYYDGGKVQAFENNPYRGYLSSMQAIAHFGLGKTTVVDSAVIQWNTGKKQVLKNVKANQHITVSIANADQSYTNEQPAINSAALFHNVTRSLGIHYAHRDFDFVDFNIQSILPHKFSENCPALAAADLDGNGLDDMIIGGNAANPAQLFLQQPNGSFVQKDLYEPKPGTGTHKDEGVLVFDANGDGKPDVYVSSGGFHNATGDVCYQDRLYINNGNGGFTIDSTALPQNHTSKLCVRAFDYNKDGKLDLFVSGRVDPGFYPKPVSSFIFRNDSQNGHAKFTDVTAEVAPALKNIGLVCDALFTDFNNDDQTDLILTGEWMPVTFLQNQNGKFKNVTAGTGIGNKRGWWSSIVAGDFRNTGRTDYIVGNVGLNTLFQASDQFPVCITAGDFAENGGYLAIPSLFLPNVNGELKEFPANGRDDIIERWPAVKKRYEQYRKFAVATMTDIIPADKMATALRLHANMLQTCFLRNDGNGKFTMIPLPVTAQMSVINGMITEDFDGDGNLDVLMNGNDFGTDISIGRYDAFNGLSLKGDGKGGFTPLSIQQSGIYIPGNGKALVKMAGSKGNYLVAASQNRNEMKIFEQTKKTQLVKVNPDDRMAILHFINGQNRKEEFYYGSSYLSQSARFIAVTSAISAVDITDNAGKMRKITFK